MKRVIVVWFKKRDKVAHIFISDLGQCQPLKNWEKLIKMDSKNIAALIIKKSTTLPALSKGNVTVNRTMFENEKHYHLHSIL